MKKALGKSVVALAVVGFFTFAGAREATADIVLSAPLIQTGGACFSSACPAGVFEWTYLAAVTQLELVTSDGAVPGVAPPGNTPSNTVKDFFTIYDFNGFIPGSNTQPAGWVFQSLPTGSTPTNVVPTDSAAFPNLTWYYNVGAAIGPGPAALGLFRARTTFNSVTTGGNYVGSATNDGTAAGSQDNKITQITTPSTTEIPEPASVLLLGTGLLACVRALRPKSKKS